MVEHDSGTLEGGAIQGHSLDHYELTAKALSGEEGLEYQIDLREPLVTRDAGSVRLGPYEDSYMISRGYLAEEDLRAAEDEVG